jgi:aspartyl protease family protein
LNGRCDKAVMFSGRASLFSLTTVALVAGGLVTARINRASMGSEVITEPMAHAAVVGNKDLAVPPGPASGQRTSRSADGLFYVTARVNGKPMRFLVDTGASVVVLTAADARLAGLNLANHSFSANVETVGGNTQMAWTTLEHVEIAGRDVQKVRAAIVQNGLGVSLLGQNALAKLASVTIEGDQLSIR